MGFWAISSAEDIQIPKDKNVCYTENVEIGKGASFPLKVLVSNVDTLAGMQVPIYFRSENVDIRCDSVSFVNSRCSNFAFNDAKIEPVGKTVYFAFIFTVDPNQVVTPLYPGDGLVATLWFTAPKETHDGVIKLDSGPNAFFPNPRIDYGYHFWTPSALEVEFLYVPGSITVK